MAIIQARLTSTRLPQKILRKIGNKSILQHCIDRVKKAKLIDEVVVASPHKIPGHKVEVWNLSQEDVLARYCYCAFIHNADVIVRITSDCPLIDPCVIDTALMFYFTHPYNYVCFAPVDGQDVEVFSRDLLDEAEATTDNPYDREHVTPYMKRVTKISVDTKEDLTKVRKLYKTNEFYQ